MRYFLMNKNRTIAEGTLQHGIEDTIRITKVSGTLPLGMQSFTAWINNRKASKHNHHLRELMIECGCDTLEGFIDVTHAASVNDTFWVKREDDPAEWEDVSLYTNDFNDTISRLAFLGLGIADPGLSSTSPELVTGGSFPKCLRKEDGTIFLYKRGLTHTRNGGLEPYCEALTGQLAGRICERAVSYRLTLLHQVPASKCRLFTDEKVGFVPMSSIFPAGCSIDDLLSYMEQFPDDSAERFRELLVLDAVTMNQDRHFGNFGVLVDNETQKPLCMAPVFDFNLALLPYVLDSEWKEIGDKLLDYGPKLGDDFTRIGQLAMTDRIRTKLEHLRGFTFSFSGDERFTKDRLDQIYRVIDRQIDAVLSRKVLYTRDVFPPKRHLEQKERVMEAKDRLDEAYGILEPLTESAGLLLSAVEDEDSEQIRIESEDGKIPDVTLDFLNGKIFLGAKECSLSGLPSVCQRLVSEIEPFLQKEEKKQRGIER